jgi:hypothetical protein
MFEGDFRKGGCDLQRVDILRWIAIVILIGRVIKMIEDQRWANCVFVEGNSVSWSSIKRTFVSRSIAKAEYRDLSQG